MITVNSNISALNARTAISKVELRSETAIQRLSTGNRINSASDDAAGISITSGMQAQIISAHQSIRNISDGIALAQTADGSMETMVSILQRMRELTLQSMNGTLSTKDKTAVRNELTVLEREFGRIANTTEWNGNQLLNGTGGDGSGNFDLQVGTTVSQDQSIRLTIPDLSNITITGTGSNTPTTQDIQLAISGVDDEYKVLVDGDVVAYPPIGATPDTVIDLSPHIKASGSTIEAIFKNNSGFGSYAYSLSINGKTVASETDPSPGGATGILKDFKYTTPADDALSDTTILSNIDDAMNTISKARSVIGATINRLNYALDLTTSVTTNVQGSRSQILETNYNLETSELARDQIISKAAMAVLAQANQLPQTVLTLLALNK